MKGHVSRWLIKAFIVLPLANYMCANAFAWFHIGYVDVFGRLAGLRFFYVSYF